MARTGWNGWNAWTGGGSVHNAFHGTISILEWSGMDGIDGPLGRILKGQRKAQLTHYIIYISSFLPDHSRMYTIDETHGVEIV